MGSAYGAGAGADELQTVLRNLTERAYRAQESKRLDADLQLRRQAADDNTAYRNEALKSQQEDRAARQLAQTQLGAERFASTTPMGSQLGPDALSRLAAGGMSGPEFVQHKDATIGSTNLSGVANNNDAGPGIGAAPRITRIARTQNPGQAASDTFLGTSGQKAVEQGRLDKIAATEADRKAKIDAAAQAEKDRQENLRLTASLRPAPQPTLMVVQTVDDNGNKVTKVVPKTAGSTFAGAPSATMEGRLASAQAATQTGDDIVKDLQNPAIRAQIGPAMGRVNSMADWLGNPPPEYADLMGNIHSYALSQLGIHGMRSSQAAEQIRKDLSGIHTPEALEGYIRGLSKFSGHLLENSGKKGPSAAGGGGAAPKRITYDINGNPIKD